MYPDFLCIGAQKAGTTWLYANVCNHPEIWMAPVKEIFYFDSPSRAPLALQLCKPSNRALRQHTFGGMTKRLARRPRRAAPASPGADSPAHAAAPATTNRTTAAQRLGWHLRFALLPRSDRWYGSLFQPEPGQIAGDINPYLANQPPATVAHIAALMPAARVIYLVRNPIDRLWSHLGMAMREHGHQSLDELDPNVLRKSLAHASTEALGAYLDNLAVWRHHYPQERVLVGFFDQLVEDPQALLRDVLGFLGRRADPAVIPPSARQRRNPGTGPRIGPEHSRYLAELFLPQLERLHGHFDNRWTARWLSDARAALAMSP